MEDDSVDLFSSATFFKDLQVSMLMRADLCRLSDLFTLFQVTSGRGFQSHSMREVQQVVDS